MAEAFGGARTTWAPQGWKQLLQVIVLAFLIIHHPGISDHSELCTEAGAYAFIAELAQLLLRSVIMAAVGHSITPEAFALAITDLPLENIYAKAAELQNSISHLLDSNVQMQPFADEGDTICRDAIRENDGVVGRLEERIKLCQTEVERRGQVWMGGSTALTNGAHPAPLTNGTGHVDVVATSQTATRTRPRLTDDELRRQLEARMNDEDDDEGLHL
jgi:hypothetical protein